jgi:hypothetical protein
MSIHYYCRWSMHEALVTVSVVGRAHDSPIQQPDTPPPGRTTGDAKGVRPLTRRSVRAATFVPRRSLRPEVLCKERRRATFRGGSEAARRT